MIQFLLIACICAAVAMAGRKRYARSLELAAFIGVSFSNYLMILLPGNLPNINVQRALVLTLFGIWWMWYRACPPPGKVAIPLGRQFKWVALSYGASLLLGLNWRDGTKDYLSFLIESLAFYHLMYRGVADKNEARSVLRAASLALVVVACFAITERYAGFNPVDRWLPGYVRSVRTARDVLSTYPHRILLGTAMAMGIPLIASQRFLFPSQSVILNRLSRLLGVTLCASACYFAMSRGPWLAAVLGLTIFGILGTARARKLCAVVAVLAILGMAMYPGVGDTLSGHFRSTKDASTPKGSTYQYRWELWRVAYAHVSASPVRLALGWGPVSSSVINQDWELSFRDGGRVQEIWSWDNEYAYYLLCYGFAGLGLTLVLYGKIGILLFRKWRAAADDDRDMLAGLSAAIAVLLFMKTNVLIFAPQLNFLLWLLVACGLHVLDTPSTAPAEGMFATRPE